MCAFEYGSSLPQRNRVAGPYPVVGSNGIAGFHNAFTVKGPVIVIGRKGSAGEVTWIEQDCVPIDTTYFVQMTIEHLSLKYLFYTLEKMDLTALRDGAGVPGLNRNDAYELELPFPPLEEQERIVAELEGYRKVIEGARQILASYKPTIRIDPEWPTKKIAEIADLEYGLTTTGREHGNARLIRITDITDDGMLSNIGAKFADLSDDAKPYLLKQDDVLVARTGATYGKTLLFEDFKPSLFASYLIRLRFGKEMSPKFYWLYSQSEWYWNQAKSLVTGGGQPQFNGNALKQVVVPIPPLDVQLQIVAELEAERKLVEANRELIARMEAKIKAKLAEVWGELGNSRAEAPEA